MEQSNRVALKAFTFKGSRLQSGSLENYCRCELTGGSNPSLSAREPREIGVFRSARTSRVGAEHASVRTFWNVLWNKMWNTVFFGATHTTPSPVFQHQERGRMSGTYSLVKDRV